MLTTGSHVFELFKFLFMRRSHGSIYLQVVRGATASKLPDIFQNSPRKVAYNQGQILAVTVLENGQ